MFYVIVPSKLQFGLYHVVDIMCGLQINTEPLSLDDAKRLMTTAESIQFALRI